MNEWIAAVLCLGQVLQVQFTVAQFVIPSLRVKDTPERVYILAGDSGLPGPYRLELTGTRE